MPKTRTKSVCEICKQIVVKSGTFCEACNAAILQIRQIKKPVGAKTVGKVVKDQKRAESNKYCDVCEKSFYKTNNFTRHYRSVHVEKDYQVYKCGICVGLRVYKYRRNLSGHIRKCHKKTMKQAAELAQNSEKIPQPSEGKFVQIMI